MKLFNLSDSMAQNAQKKLNVLSSVEMLSIRGGDGGGPGDVPPPPPPPDE